MSRNIAKETSDEQETSLEETRNEEDEIMKRRKLTTGDLMIATLIFKLLLVATSLATTLVRAHPNSIYPHHMIHHLHQHQYQHQRRHRPLTFTSNVDRDNNDDLMASVSNQDESFAPNRSPVPFSSSSSHSSASTTSQRLSPPDDDSPNEPNETALGDATEHDEVADNSQELPDRNPLFMDHHQSRLRAMQDLLFERRQLVNNHHHQIPSSQELSPISIGLDQVSGPGSPFSMPPFSVPNHDGGPPVPHNKPLMSNADNIDQGLGPALPFGLNPLPHLLGFQGSPFNGPQRGDQSAHTNHHAASSEEVGTQPKVWPKVFRFTEGRINLSDFEKQKKIRLSSKNQQHGNENHIESAPVMFDGRQLKRKSFLILHGGIFS